MLLAAGPKSYQAFAVLVEREFILLSKKLISGFPSKLETAQVPAHISLRLQNRLKTTLQIVCAIFVVNEKPRKKKRKKCFPFQGLSQENAKFACQLTRATK